MQQHLLQISVGERTFNPAAATHFKLTSVNHNGLFHLLKQHSYSLLAWRVDDERPLHHYNRKRLGSAFEKAFGIVADIDGGLSITAARERLHRHNLNYAIITSKSHLKEKGEHPPADRYHILLFFREPVTDAGEYKACFEHLTHLFPEMDTAVKDTARFIFPSPPGAEYFAWWDGVWFDDISLPSCPLPQAGCSTSAGAEGIKGSMPRPSRGCVNPAKTINSFVLQLSNKQTDDTNNAEINQQYYPDIDDDGSPYAATPSYDEQMEFLNSLELQNTQPPPAPSEVEHPACGRGERGEVVNPLYQQEPNTSEPTASNISRGHNTPLNPLLRGETKDPLYQQEPISPPERGRGSMSRPSRECVKPAEEMNSTKPEQPPDEATERTSKRGNEFTFPPTQLVTLATGEVKKVIELEGKHPCRCIREEHTDEHPSAFVQWNEERGKHFIHCSGCGSTGWCAETKFESGLDALMEDYYSLGTEIVKFGMKRDVLFQTRVTNEAFYVLMGARTGDEKKAAFNRLVTTKRLECISSVEYVADAALDNSTFAVNIQSGIVEVHIAPVNDMVDDNGFIERYLEETFGAYKGFIKEYLAMYAYTNFIHLPTLVLYGPRGTSKSTFANMVAAMYPSLYMDWTGSVASFTPEAEKKLLIVEENISDDKAQYKMLKKYTGQPYLLVNKKYQQEYHVRNNLNLILLSNEHVPLYVEKSEMPADERNNQFFVYEFPRLATPPDAYYSQKLRERLGHYLRTELRAVYSAINDENYRYGIPVPITEYEKQLFENNTTNIETAATQIIEKIENNIPPHAREDYLTDVYKDGMELFKNGYLSVALLSEYTTKEFHTNTIIKNLKKRGVIGEEPVRRKLKNRRYLCYRKNSDTKPDFDLN